MSAVQAPAPRLVVTHGPQRGWVFELPPGDTTVGRLPDAGFRLDEPTVSRSHAEVSNRNGKVTVTDLGSVNGTWVNGDR